MRQICPVLSTIFRTLSFGLENNNILTIVGTTFQYFWSSMQGSRFSLLISRFLNSNQSTKKTWRGSIFWVFFVVVVGGCTPWLEMFKFADFLVGMGEMSPKLKCLWNFNVTITQMSQKLKWHLNNWNSPITEVPPNLKCHQN